METLFTAITTAFEQVLGWIGTFITSLVTAEGELNPLLGLVSISIAVSLVMLGIKCVRSFSWGW